MDLALNNLQRLICHKTQQTQTQKPEQQFHNDIYISSLKSSTRELFSMEWFSRTYRKRCDKRCTKKSGIAFPKMMIAY